MKQIASSCAAVTCPAVYETDDRYIVVGRIAEDHDETTASDHATVTVPKQILNQAQQR